MKRALLLTALLASAAFAQSATITARINFTAPTTFTDGSTIPTGAGSQPITYNVYGGVKGSTTKPLVVSGQPGNPITIPNAPPGRCYNVTAVVAGVESDRSNEACSPMAPNSPNSLTITVVVTVSP